jgi:hypothetical protein
MKGKRFGVMPVILFVLSAGLCFGQQTLVVPPVYNRGAGLSAGDLETITDLILNAIQRQGRFDVPDRETIALRTAELKFQMSDWSDDAKSIQMGKAINANYLARSIIAPLDGTVNLLQIRILDINTTKILGRAQELEFTTLRDLRGKLDGFLKEVTATITTEKTKVVPKTYQIGDRGPAGGWVFYDKGVISNGWRYLEAGPPEAEFRAEWGAYERDLSGTADAVGTGRRNTQVVVEYLGRRRIGRASESGKAAQLCDSLSMGSYDDWFLPSRDELNLMYWNLKRKGLGEFSNALYWSSSSVPADIYSCAQDFHNGSQGYYYKYYTYSVRAVRAF